MKYSSYCLKILPLDLRSNENNGSSPPAVALNASARGALPERCNKAISDEYGDAYILGFERTARFLKSRGAPPGHAEELSQAAWVRGWERLHQFRGDSAVSSWVNTIALNLFRRELQQVRSVQPLTETQSDFRMDIAAIDATRILSFSRPRDRALFEHQLNGVTVDELARVFGVTSTAIRIRLLRARRAVRLQLERRAARLRRSPVLALTGANLEGSGSPKPSKNGKRGLQLRGTEISERGTTNSSARRPD